MTSAKQTAMKHYGFTEWPYPPLRTPAAADCRGYACKLMRESGIMCKVVAYEVGFADVSWVRRAIKRYEARA